MEESQKRVAENQQRSECTEPRCRYCFKGHPWEWPTNEAHLCQASFSAWLSSILRSTSCRWEYVKHMQTSSPDTAFSKICNFLFRTSVSVPCWKPNRKHQLHLEDSWKWKRQVREGTEVGSCKSKESLAFIFNLSHEVSFHRSICLCHRTQPCCLEKHVSLSHRWCMSRDPGFGYRQSFGDVLLTS